MANKGSDKINPLYYTRCVESRCHMTVKMQKILTVYSFRLENSDVQQESVVGSRVKCHTVIQEGWGCAANFSKEYRTRHASTGRLAALQIPHM
jgi:hypothetical protein